MRWSKVSCNSQLDSEHQTMYTLKVKNCLRKGFKHRDKPHVAKMCFHRNMKSKSWSQPSPVLYTWEEHETHSKNKFAFLKRPRWQDSCLVFLEFSHTAAFPNCVWHIPMYMLPSFLYFSCFLSGIKSRPVNAGQGLSHWATLTVYGSVFEGRAPASVSACLWGWSPLQCLALCEDSDPTLLFDRMKQCLQGKRMRKPKLRNIRAVPLPS